MSLQFNDSYSIRLALASELPRLREIERAAGQLFLNTEFSHIATDDALPLPELAEAQQAGRLWVAAHETDQAVGFALVKLVDEQPHLHEISVHPAHGMRGLGKRLIRMIQAWAQQQGYVSLTLLTFRQIPWNAPYYARLGFSSMGAHEITHGLRALQQLEERHGLKSTDRVCMRYVLTT